MVREERPSHTRPPIDNQPSESTFASSHTLNQEEHDDVLGCKRAELSPTRKESTRSVADDGVAHIFITDEGETIPAEAALRKGRDRQSSFFSEPLEESAADLMHLSDDSLGLSVESESGYSESRTSFFEDLERQNELERERLLEAERSRDSSDSQPIAFHAESIFDPENFSAVVGSVINLINTIMGTGMLSMAYAFAAVGLLGGTLLVVISAAATWFSLRLLISSARLAHGPHPLQEPSYGSLAALTIRSKFGRIVVDLIVAVSCMGMASSYIVAIGDVMPRFIADILGIDSVDPSMGMLSLSMGEPHAFWIRILLSRQFWMIAFLFVLVPLSMQFTIDDISWFSTTCLGFALYLAAVVLWASFTIGRKPDDDTPTSDHTAREPLPLFLFSERWLEVLPIFVFAFTCQQNLFSIFGELKESKAKYIGRVIDSAVIATAAIYLIVGLAGYYTFGAACDGNIINNFPPSWPMSVARLAFAGLAALSYPIQVHPCRLSLLNIYKIVCRYYIGPGDFLRREPSISEGYTQSLLIAPQLVSSRTSIDSPAPSMTPVAVAPPTLAAALLEVDPYTRTYLTVRWYLRYMIGLGPWNRSDDRSVVLTTIIVCTTYIMVMSVIYLDEVLAFVGATGGTLVCYIIPALFYHRIIFQSSRNKIGAWKHVGALTMATTGCVCGILGLLYSWL